MKNYTDYAEELEEELEEEDINRYREEYEEMTNGVDPQDCY